MTSIPTRSSSLPGTSESYAWLFKLLCDPQDCVLVPRPSYPLFEFLAGLESIAIESYPLRREGRWEDRRTSASKRLPRDSHRRAGGRDPRPRAIVAVNPNNPTGSYLSRADARILHDIALEQDLVLISDEVFFSYSDRSGSRRSAELEREGVSLLGSDTMSCLRARRTVEVRGHARHEGGMDRRSGSHRVSSRCTRAARGDRGHVSCPWETSSSGRFLV